MDVHAYIDRSSNSDRGQNYDNFGAKPKIKEVAVPAAKKPYTTPTLKLLGTVSQLTNGATGSVADGGSTKRSGS